MQNLGAFFQFPNYWCILNDFDKFQYGILRVSLSTHYAKNQRNKRVGNFTEILELIKRFCIRGDADDWRRCLVCGVCWLPNGIAVNTRQLKLLIFKCKSSINGSLHKMGYSVNFGRAEPTNSLVMAIPILKDNINELRQWTIRQCVGQCASPVSPPSTVQPVNQPTIQTEVSIDCGRSKPLPIPNINFNTVKKEDEVDSFDPLLLIDRFGLGVPFDIDTRTPSIELDLV
ncbi:hypothetical protein TVAG_004410 [Trichomonas vaginalis G3]|uniref:Initiator binding domain-containing protein n=1 Tax=Trichomonas vaginalis (strain ATCC PRA-98 / G3) TaxID=412133 RepID=A2DT03_TRIV3|nr:transcription-initiator DNA-binding domain ibd family [Trichomonas vaginalis G3]EAY16410.1 hypothetical protein TVAG_004410 [Trichomonas vaginalis G3]KAI5505741.1 transcription-initiator DNA-binding domain ibd family [Trichomonas vaginalis G3]|eukprot:XP_001328633.1 hypothetical protein [Trichomonas vaginalis G3]